MKTYYPKEKCAAYSDIRALVTGCGKFGEKTVYKYIVGKDEVKELSYKTFSDNIIKLSTALYALKLKGKKIALLSESRPEWLQSYLATLCAKAVIVPLDKELMPEQIVGFINHAECDAIFVSPTYIKKLGYMLDETAVSHIINLEVDDCPPPSVDYESIASAKMLNFYELINYGEHLLSAGFMGVYNLTYDNEALAAILFTSGTTGTSKGVMLSHKNLLTTAAACVNATPFTHDDVFLSVLPMHHTYECTIDLAILHLGATVCINNSIKYVLKNLKRFRPTGLVLVPLFVQTIHKRIMDEIKKKGKLGTFSKGVMVTKTLRKIKIDLRRPVFSEILSSLGGRLKTVICGGAALDPVLVESFEQMGVSLYQGYGITECSPLISVDLYTKSRSGSVGPAIRCCDVKVVHEADGCFANVENGDIGEIAVKGDNVMLGYYRDPVSTKAVFTDDGYFLTGDLGKMDDDGYIYITGRKKNLIILSNGKNVYPEEIEEYLMRLDSVKECAVVARNNNLGETVITAIIQPESDVLDLDNDDAIQERIKIDVLSVNKLLPTFKQIRNIEIRKTDFDKTSSQKIKRFML